MNHLYDFRKTNHTISVINLLIYTNLFNILRMKRIDARFIPKDVKLLQKRLRVAVVKEIIENVAEDASLNKRIITVGES